MSARARLVAPALAVGAVVAASAALLAGPVSAAPPTPAPSPAHATGRPAVPPVALLTQQATTVLGQQLAYPGGEAQVSSSVITLQPGQRTGRHRHDAPMYAYVLKGAVTVTYDGGVVRTYTKGSALMEAVGVAHEGANLGHVPCVLLVVNIGSDEVANTVRL